MATPIGSPPTDRLCWRRRSISVAIVSSFVVILAACSSATSENGEIADNNGEQATVDDGVADGGTDSRAGGTRVNQAGFEVVGAAYDDVDYDAEAVGSALQGERNRADFPPPLISPSAIVPVLGPDVIPAIDDPQFVDADEVEFMQPNEAVVVAEVDSDVRAYPVQVLVWHEIVNDEIGGVPVSVTYCPLCNSALAFDRRVGERVLDFGTSGSLYQSALVMYDRQTESLWAHFTGEGVVGHYAGARLEPIPVQTLSFEQFNARYPDGLVLSRDTGVSRDYGTNPYIGYDEESSGPISGFFQGEVDPRLEPKARVVGIVRNGDAYAATLEPDETSSVHEVDIGDETLVIFHRPGLASALDRASVAAGREVGQTGVFVPRSADGESLTFSADANGFVDDQTGSTWTVTGEAVSGPLAGERLEPVGHLNTFWFAWSGYHPDTAIVDG